MRKADLLDACAAKGGNESSKEHAFWFLKGFFVEGPERARRKVEDDLKRKAENVFERAKAGYDDVDKEELLEACMILRLEGATTKKGAYDLLVEHYRPRVSHSDLCRAPTEEEIAQMAARRVLEAAQNRGADAYDYYYYGQEDFDPRLQAEGEEEA